MSVESPALTRRQAIAATTAAAIIPTTATAAVDPHPAWLEEWRALTEIEATLANDDDYPTNIDHVIADLADLIASTPAVTPAGMITKLQLLRESSFDYGERLTEIVGASSIIIQLEHFLGSLS